MREFTVGFRVEAGNHREAIRRVLEALGAELVDPDLVAEVTVPDQGVWTVNLSRHPDLFPRPAVPDMTNVVSPFGRPVRED